MLSRWHAHWVAPVLARLGGSWPISPASCGVAVAARRLATTLGSWLAGSAHITPHPHAVVFVAVSAGLFIICLPYSARAGRDV